MRHGVGQPSVGLEHLTARLTPDNGLQLPNDRRIRGRADARADEVVRRLDVRDPVADRLARGLLQRPRAELDRAHLRAEKPHPLDVRMLPAHVLGAHVDDALEPEARADGRSGNAMLPGPRLGDDPALTEPRCEQDLPDRVVDLVRARVAEVLALEHDLPALRCEALGLVQRRRTADVVLAQAVELSAERRVGDRLRPALLELVERRDERLRDEAPAVRAVQTARQARAAST